MDLHALKELLNKGSLETHEIQKILPHRYPFLMLDRVSYLSEAKILAQKNFTANEEFFQGHFPQYPLVPGVLIIEALAQAGGILLLKKTLNQNSVINAKDFLPLFLGINEARFRKQVLPGDILELNCELLQEKAQIAKIKGQAYIIRKFPEKELATTAELLIGYK
jgi:beta-hydroxyacyl-ACP dehydratase FabZ